MTTCRPNTVQIKPVQVSFPGSLSPPQTFDRSQYGDMEKVLSCAMTSGRQKEARHTGDIASYPGSQWGKSLGRRLTRDSTQQRVMGLLLVLSVQGLKLEHSQGSANTHCFKNGWALPPYISSYLCTAFFICGSDQILRW